MEREGGGTLDPRVESATTGSVTLFRHFLCDPPVYAFGFAEARTEADFPEESYRNKM
jgi:hypothetical protein